MIPELDKGNKWEPILFHLAIALSVSGLFAISCHFPFFWDTVQLSSRQASWVYTQGSYLLPDIIDSGHPPGMGYYLAFIWQSFGRELLVSHAAMLSWIYLFLWGSGKLLQRLTGQRSACWFAFLFLADAVFLGHFSLISPDLILMTAFVWSLLGMFQRQGWILLVAIFVLCCISLRGMMISAALLIFVAIRNYKAGVRHIYLIFLAFIPGLLTGGLFLLYHYQAKGWIGYNMDSPWAASFTKVNLGGSLRNVGIIFWRLLDFGRVGVLLFLAWIFLRYRSARIWQHSAVQSLLILIGVALLIITPSMIIHTGILAHRYLMPVFYLLTILAVVGAYALRESHSLRPLTIAMPLLILLSGNIWQYPQGVSMGWDCTPLHWAFFKPLRQNLAYMQEAYISPDSVQTYFPMINKMDDLFLDGDARSFQVGGDGPAAPYTLTATVMNDMPDSLQTALSKKGQLLFQAESGAIQVSLFKNTKD